MKGYRITHNQELERVLKNKSIVNNYAENHAGCNNTFGAKLNHSAAFWFFQNLQDAVVNFGIITHGAEPEENYVICEYDIDDSEIIARGFGGYSGFFCDPDTPEFITRRIYGADLVMVHTVVECYDQEDDAFYYELSE